MMTTPIHPFVMFPARIWHLPGITIQLLKFYEKIFQFWHQGYECFVSNKTLMEYSGMKSDSTVRDAFTYYEKHNELKRVMKNGKRYIIPPQPRVTTDSVDNLEKNGANDDHTSAVALGGERCGAGGTSAVALPNNINIIKQNNKKLLANAKQKKPNSVYKSKAEWKIENEKKPEWNKPKAALADVTKQSTSWNAETHGKEINRSPEAVKEAMMSLPRHMRPKKYRDDANTTDDKTTQSTELSTGTSLQSDVPTRSEPDSQGAAIDAERGKDNPSQLRGSNRVMEARRVCAFVEEIRLAN